MGNTKKKQSSLPSKDILSICFSLIALSISVASFYFSNLRIDDNLKVRVTDIEISNNTINSDLDTISIQVAYMNGGNRQAIILSPWYQITDSINAYNGTWGGPFLNEKKFPIILESREMKLVDLKIPSKDVTMYSKPNLKKEENFFLAIEYYCLDSKARKYSVLGNFNIVFSVLDNKINSFKSLEKLNEEISTDLFPRIKPKNYVEIEK